MHASHTLILKSNTAHVHLFTSSWEAIEELGSLTDERIEENERILVLKSWYLQNKQAEETIDSTYMTNILTLV